MYIGKPIEIANTVTVGGIGVAVGGTGVEAGAHPLAKTLSRTKARTEKVDSFM
jgi:hypothetical protein